MMSWLMVSCLVLLLVYFMKKWRKRKNRLPRGPSILESHWIMLKVLLNNNLLQISEELSLKYGELFNLPFLGNNMVFLNSNRLMKKIFNTAEFKDVTNDRPPSFIRDYVFRGQDIAFRDNDAMLSKLRKIFHGVSKMYGTGLQKFEDMITGELLDMERDMINSCNKDRFNMEKPLTETLIKIIHIFLTSTRTDNIEDIVPVSVQFNTGISKSLAIVNNLVLTVLPVVRHIPGKYQQLAIDLSTSLNKLKEIFANQTIKKILKGNGSLIGQLCELQEQDPTITDDIIESLILEVISAGFLTTKTFLMGFFLMMVIYPEVQQRVQQELDEVLWDRRPTLEDRTQLHYTQAVILEVFRYVRHAPLGIPHFTRSDIEVEGFTIPAGSMLITNYWVTAHDVSFWKDPKVFRPERYLDENGKLLSVNDPIRTHFNSFGSGRRSCVGEIFARSRIFLFVTFLLQKFEFEKGDNPISGEDSSQWEPNINLEPNFLYCKISERMKST